MTTILIYAIYGIIAWCYSRFRGYYGLKNSIESKVDLYCSLAFFIAFWPIILLTKQ